MKKLTQVFHNSTDVPQFINLELSTARFRINPAEELILRYNPIEVQDGAGAALKIDFIRNNDTVELVVWTHEDSMFRPDGTQAPLDYSL